MQQDVVGFQRGIGAEFAAPVALLVLNGEQVLARGIDRRGDSALDVVQLPKRISAGTGGERCCHSSSCSYSARAGAAPMASTISGGRPKRTFSGITSTSCRCEALLLEESQPPAPGSRAPKRPPSSATVFTPSSHSGRWTEILDQVRLGAQVARHLHQAVGVGAVVRANHQQQIAIARRPSLPSGGSRWRSRCPARAGL